jgi:thioredoxin reductase
MLDVVIIGAGPYGLSMAAYFRGHGIPFRIFGRLMDSWSAHMPKGMFLKSDGFASNIYDPDGGFTLERFCADRGIGYSDTGRPVSLDTFVAYGLAFKERMVPELEDKVVVELDRLPNGFRLRLEDGEVVSSRRVVLAVGITHFEYVPDNLATLPPEFLSHSSRHRDLEVFRGRKVVVIGGGASALDLAGLLRDADADVQLVARRKTLKFHTKPSGKPRSWWQRIRNPQSGLGPGLRSRFFANAPMLFHYLPESLRLHIVKTHLGPSGGWFTRDKVVGRMPLLLGYTLEVAQVQGDKILLGLRSIEGSKCEILADHVIAATGYRVDTSRLKFLSASIQGRLEKTHGSPVLSSSFESSIPGLYFIGVAAANSFGPLMRFAFGAGFTARRVTKTIMASRLSEYASVTAPSVVTIAK